MSNVADKFMFYESTPEGKRLKTDITEMFIALAEELDSMLPAGRNKAIMMTKLEEAAYHAKASTSRALETR